MLYFALRLSEVISYLNKYRARWEGNMKNLKSGFVAACCSAIAISLAMLGPLTTQAEPPQPLS